MSLITAQNLVKSFGPDDIFEGISLTISQRARIAIVGANGVGKTTLLRILIGEDGPNLGSVQHARDLTIGYLPQEATLATRGTLWETCLPAFADLIEMEAELEVCMKTMSESDQTDAAVDRYGKLEQAFDRRGGYTYEVRIRQTLSGLGFEEKDYNRPVTQLSGGQRTRAMLAKLLLESPDVLMLDEPTNHLDIQAVEWLESFLKDWDGALVVVSHDRYFLDQVAQTIWEMTPALEVYRGNYSTYLTQREERYGYRLAEYEAQTAFIEKEQEFIRRNIAGQKTNQAKGRQRRLERLLEDARLAPPPSEPRRMHIHLNTKGRSGDLVLRTHDLQVGYEDEGQPLFDCPDLVLQRQGHAHALAAHERDRLNVGRLEVLVEAQQQARHRRARADLEGVGGRGQRHALDAVRRQGEIGGARQVGPVQPDQRGRAELPGEVAGVTLGQAGVEDQPVGARREALDQPGRRFQPRQGAERAGQRGVDQQAFRPCLPELGKP